MTPNARRAGWGCRIWGALGFLRQLLGSRAGHFRIFLIAVINKRLGLANSPAERDELSSIPGLAPRDLALSLDTNTLADYSVHVFVYHFVKQEGPSGAFEFLIGDAQSLPVLEHLKRSGLQSSISP